MGDGFERRGAGARGRHPGRVRALPPAPILEWGLAAPIGHNGGPPLEEPVDLFVRWRWRKAHREAWKNPPRSIMLFRLSRARAAGVSYRTYTAELLDSGRHIQRADVEAGSVLPGNDEEH
jgi:hypothetical protein